MKLEDQVCSLELSKKLKELGVKQESCFIWVMSTESPRDGYKNGEYKLTTFRDPFCNAVTNYYAAGRDNEKFPMFSAYTVAELGELLVNQGQNFFPYYCDQAEKKCFVHNWSGSYPDHVLADKEADCRAKMLIYLIENNLLTLSHE